MTPFKYPKAQSFRKAQSHFINLNYPLLTSFNLLEYSEIQLWQRSERYNITYPLWGIHCTSLLNKNNSASALLRIINSMVEKYKFSLGKINPKTLESLYWTDMNQYKLKFLLDNPHQDPCLWGLSVWHKQIQICGKVKQLTAQTPK